jgi:hypothetical protein
VFSLSTSAKSIYSKESAYQTPNIILLLLDDPENHDNDNNDKDDDDDDNSDKEDKDDNDSHLVMCKFLHLKNPPPSPPTPNLR